MRRRGLIVGSGVGAAAFVVLVLLLFRSAPAGDLERLRRGGVLRIGISDDYAPFVQATTGTRAGFDVDLTVRLARDLGLSPRWVRFDWPHLSDDLRAHRFDVVASGVTVRPERALVGRFTRPYAVTGAVALIRRADAVRLGDVATLDRPGVRIEVNGGGYLERVARSRFARAEIVPLADNRALGRGVLASTADAAISDSAEARSLVRPELAMLGPFTRDRKAVCVDAAAPELFAWTEAWLVARERDGFLADLRRRYLADEVSARDMDAEAVLGAIELRLSLVRWVGELKARSGKPIRDSVQEARVLARSAESARSRALDPESVRALYGVLMACAREVEAVRVVGASNPLPTLDVLRGAIAAVDGELVAALAAATDSDPHRDWRTPIDRGIADGLSAPSRTALAQALTAIRRSR